MSLGTQNFLNQVIVGRVFNEGMNFAFSLGGKVVSNYSRIREVGRRVIEVLKSD